MNANFPILIPETRLLPFYVTGVGMKHHQNPIVREKGYADYQFTICLDGEGIFKAEDKSYQIEKGKGFFFNPLVAHEYYPTKEPWTVKWVIFNGEQVQTVLNAVGIGSHIVFETPFIRKYDEILEEIYFVLQGEELNKHLKCSAALYSLIANWGMEAKQSRDAVKSEKRRKIDAVLLYMEANYSRSISLKELASLIHVSPNFLCRLFKENCNTSPFKYLIKLRIQKAKHLFFKSPDLLIKDVALQVGFHDISYFCLSFKEQEGISPAQFRRIHGIG